MILFLLSIAFCTKAQDNCLPVYSLPVKNIQLSSGRMAYVEKGKGKVLIFIHGLGGNISHCVKVINDLSSSYRCIAIDLPGYGYSTNTNQNSSDQLSFYANVVMQFAKKLKIKYFDLVGHSMGGQIAVIMGLNHPKIIKRLILVNPAGLETFTSGEAKLLTTYTTTAFFAGQDEAAIRTSFKNNFYSLPEDAEALIRYRLKLKACVNANDYYEVLVKGVNGMLNHPVKDDLKNLKQNVLVVLGENDNLIPNKLLHPALTGNDISKIATDNIPGVKLKIISKAGHMLPFEQPSLLNKAIKEFVQ